MHKTAMKITDISLNRGNVFNQSRKKVIIFKFSRTKGFWKWEGYEFSTSLQHNSRISEEKGRLNLLFGTDKFFARLNYLNLTLKAPGVLKENWHLWNTSPCIINRNNYCWEYLKALFFLKLARITLRMLQTKYNRYVL